VTSSSFQGRSLLFGVTGSIAAFKAAAWVHALVKEGTQVQVVMTQAATHFVSPLTFAALSGRPVHTEMFAEAMTHISLAKAADAVLLAPTTAHTLARLAQGLADDLLSALVLASTAPVLVCPAMNSAMLAHPATQANIEKLRQFGYTIVDSDHGPLACGDEGAGRLAEWDRVREALLLRLGPADLAGQKILITAGPTQEPLDPARFLSNRSSGKMGYALARTALRRGAEVLLISGPVALAPPPGLTLLKVQTAEEMAAAVFAQAPRASIVVKAAAVADFRPSTLSPHKVKKQTAETLLSLTATTDILATLGKNRQAGQILVGFAAESCQHQAEGYRKLLAKQADLIVVNDILGHDTGFASDTNQITLITKEDRETVPLLTKEETADRIWDKVLSLLHKNAS
jgi:phosphopantothenoylcysteine decarboxylase/phosphopantothenate--cysteine ligase